MSERERKTKVPLTLYSPFFTRTYTVADEFDILILASVSLRRAARARSLSSASFEWVVTYDRLPSWHFLCCSAVCYQRGGVVAFFPHCRVARVQIPSQFPSKSRNVWLRNYVRTRSFRGICWRRASSRRDWWPCTARLIYANHPKKEDRIWRLCRYPNNSVR